MRESGQGAIPSTVLIGGLSMSVATYYTAPEAGLHILIRSFITDAPNPDS